MLAAGRVIPEYEHWSIAQILLDEGYIQEAFDVVEKMVSFKYDSILIEVMRRKDQE